MVVFRAQPDRLHRVRTVALTSEGQLPLFRWDISLQRQAHHDPVLRRHGVNRALAPGPLHAPPPPKTTHPTRASASLTAPYRKTASGRSATSPTPPNPGSPKSGAPPYPAPSPAPQPHQRREDHGPQTSPEPPTRAVGPDAPERRRAPAVPRCGRSAPARPAATDLRSRSSLSLCRRRCAPRGLAQSQRHGLLAFVVGSGLSKPECSPPASPLTPFASKPESSSLLWVLPNWALLSLAQPATHSRAKP